MPAHTGVRGHPGRLVDRHDVGVEHQDRHALDVDRDVLHRGRGVGQPHRQPRAGVQPVGLADRDAVEFHPAVLGDRRRGGAGQPEQPGQAGVDPHSGQTLGHRHGAFGHVADSAGRLRPGVVSNSYPNNDGTTSRIAPPTTAGSATLVPATSRRTKVDDVAAHRPRRPEETVHQIAQRTAQDHAQADRPHGETSRRPIQTMPRTTPRATRVSTQV